MNKMYTCKDCKNFMPYYVLRRGKFCKNDKGYCCVRTRKNVDANSSICEKLVLLDKTEIQQSQQEIVRQLLCRVEEDLTVVKQLLLCEK